MMFLGSFSGYSIDVTPINSDTTEYIEIENGIFDEVYMDGDTTIEYDTNIPDWGYTTILDAKFKNNILAGNVDFTLASISDMVIKKRKYGNYKWITIDKIPIVTEQDFNRYFNDIVVASKTKYQYAAVPIINGAEGTYQIIDVDVEFEGAFVIDSTRGYQVYLNMTSDNTTRNIPSNIIEPVNSKYPYIYYHSKMQYDRFPVSGVFIENLGNDEWDIDNGWKYREEIRNFASNQLTKIVKFYDGRIYMACVVDSITESTGNHPDLVTTTMQFVTVGDVESNSDLYYHGFSNYLEVGG